LGGESDGESMKVLCKNKREEENLKEERESYSRELVGA
jgi:hypothetical protein